MWCGLLPLVLILSLFCGPKAHAIHSGLECIHLITEKRALRRSEVPQIQIGGDSYLLGDVLGESTAKVIRTSDSRSAIKAFPPSRKYDAALEYWTTLYYETHRIPVLPSSAPETAYLGQSPVVVLVKSYREGLTDAEFENACRDSLSSQCARLREGREELRKTLRELHAGGKFIDWLRGQGQDPILLFGPLADVLDFIDVGNGNFLLTSEGWVVIDP